MAMRCFLSALVLLYLHGLGRGDSECSTICSKDYLWLAGDVVVWSCTLTPTNCKNYSAKDIYFSHGQTRFPDNFMEIVNETRLLRVANAKPCYGDCSYMYYVYLGEKNTDSIEMQVGEKPLPPHVEVEYFIFNGAAKRVNVTATPLQPYKRFNMSFDYGFDGLPFDYDDLNYQCKQYKGENASGCRDYDLAYPCGCPSQEINTCSFTNAGGSICFMDRLYFFRVTMTTRFGSATQMVNVTLSEAIAQAPEFQNLTAYVNTSKNVVIKWIKWPNVDVSFRLTICAENRSNCQEPQETLSENFNFRNLTPNTRYHVKIETRMLKNPKWGGAKWIDCATLEDIPYSSPSVSPGSYSFSDDGLRVFTKAIPVNERNGNIILIKAMVQQFPSGKMTRFEFSAGNSTLFFRDIKQLDGCRVEIQGCTSVGCSNKTSVIVIPGDSVAPPKPCHIIAEKQQSNEVKLTWHRNTTKRTDASRIGYIVHKCTLANRLSAFPDCAEYNWYMVELDGDVLYYNITMPPSVQLDNLRVGVSMTEGNISSQAAWGACLYDAGTVPSTVSSLESQMLENDITVEWEAPDCHKHSSYPRAYDVTYGKLEDNTLPSKCASGTAVIVQAADCTYDAAIQGDGGKKCVKRLEKVESAQGYFVCVRAVSDKGSGVYMWREVKIKVDDKTTLAVVLGCGFGVAAAAIFLCFVCRRSRKKKKLSFPLPEMPPEVPDDDLYGSSYPNGNGNGIYPTHGNGYESVLTDATDVSPVNSVSRSSFWSSAQTNGGPARVADKTSHDSGSSLSPLQNLTNNINNSSAGTVSGPVELPSGGSSDGHSVAADDGDLPVVDSDDEECDPYKGNNTKKPSEKSGEKSLAVVSDPADQKDKQVVRVRQPSQSSSAASYAQMSDDTLLDEDQALKEALEKFKSMSPTGSARPKNEGEVKEKKKISPSSPQSMQTVDSMV